MSTRAESAYLAFAALIGLFLSWILLLAGRSVLLLAFLLFLSIALWRRFASAGVAGVLTAPFESAIARSSLFLDGLPLSIPLWGAFVLRFSWGAAYRVVPKSDFAVFYNQAVRFSEGKFDSLGAAKSPATVLYYGTIFKLFDDSLIFVYLFNALLGLAQTWLVYKISAKLFRSRGAGMMGALLVAFFPSLIAYSGNVGSEMPFAALLLISILLASELSKSIERDSPARIVVLVFLFSLTVAAMHLARNLGFFLGLVTAFIVASRMSSGLKRKAALFVSVAFLTLASLSPLVIHNYREYGILSINSSRWGAINLLIGTNRESKGRWNNKDIITVTGRRRPDNRMLVETSARARSLAFQRIAADPMGFLGFALKDKVEVMWTDDSYPLAMTFPKQRSEIVKKRMARIYKRMGRYSMWPERNTWERLANGYYFVVLFLTLCSLPMMITRRNIDRTLLLVITALIVATMAFHILLEVKPRYHYHVVFLFCILCGGVIGHSEGNGSLVDVA